MPQYLLFTSFLLISHLTTNGRASRAVTHAITDNDLQHHCDFELNGYRYNLCPLTKRTTVVQARGVGSEIEDRGEGSSSGKRFYEVALGGLGLWSPTDVISKSADPNCDENTWVCMLDVPYSDSEQETVGDMTKERVRRAQRATPIARNVKRSRQRCSLKATVSIDIEDNSGNPSSSLRLSLHDGRTEEKAQSAEISIFCSEEENLSFVGEEEGIHSFVWATPHGCPTGLPPHAHPGISIAQEPGSDNSENGEAPPEENEGDDDLLPPSKSKIRRWIAIILVVLVTGLAGGFILISSTRLRHLTSEKLKGIGHTVVPLLADATTKLRPIGTSINNLTSKSIDRFGSRFRQGDSQLVRWAQEDMSLADSEDVMVNGAGAYDRYNSQDEGWNADGLDEYIPLTISPKYGQGRRVKSYGATPDVETFAERGIMTGLGKYFHK